MNRERPFIGAVGRAAIVLVASGALAACGSGSRSSEITEAPVPPSIGSTTPAEPAPGRSLIVRLPHEEIVARRVCGPLLAALQNPPESSKVTAEPVEGAPEFKFFRLTHSEPRLNQKTTITAGSEVRGEHIDPSTVYHLEARLSEGGTSPVTPDNPQGDTTLTEVRCSEKPLACNDVIETWGNTKDGTRFDTEDYAFYRRKQMTAADQTRLDAETEVAVRAAREILASIGAPYSETDLFHMPPFIVCPPIAGTEDGSGNTRRV